MIAETIAPIDQPASDEPVADPPLVADLLATIAALEADNARLRAEHPAVVPEWRALKAVDHGQYTYEAARQWCADGKVTAEKRRGRWFVLVGSMVQRLRELAI
jgi:hypothetical protein